MSDQVDEMARDGRKWNPGKLTPHHDEIFANLVPELRTLARGYFWRVYRDAPFSQDACSIITTVILVMIFAPLFYFVADYYRPASEAGRVAGLVVASLICGLMGAFLTKWFGDIELREQLLKKNTATYSRDRCKEIARNVLILSNTFRESELKDAALLERAAEHGIDETCVYHMLEYHVDQLHKDAKSISRDLLSPKLEDRARAFENVAGDSLGSIGREVRQIRKEQSKAVEELEAKIAEKALNAEAERLYQEVSSVADNTPKTSE